MAVGCAMHSTCPQMCIPWEPSTEESTGVGDSKLRGPHRGSFQIIDPRGCVIATDDRTRKLRAPFFYKQAYSS